MIARVFTSAFRENRRDDLVDHEFRGLPGQIGTVRLTGREQLVRLRVAEVDPHRHQVAGRMIPVDSVAHDCLNARRDLFRESRQRRIC